MTGSDVFHAALLKSGTTRTEIAEYVGWTPSNLYFHVRRDTIPFDVLVRILKYCGLELSIKDENGLELQNYGNGTGPRITRKIAGKVYDTGKASMIVSTMEKDGPDKFSELYVGIDGTYFVVHYDKPLRNSKLEVLDQGQAEALKSRL